MAKIKRFILLNFLLKPLKFLGITIPPFPTVSGIIPIGNNKVLMIDLSYLEGLALPGGGVHPGENFEEALKREVKEETGLDVTDFEILGTFSAIRPWYTTAHICFFVSKYGGERKEGSSEGKVVEVPIEEAAKRCVYEDEKTALKVYESSLKR